MALGLSRVGVSSSTAWARSFFVHPADCCAASFCWGWVPHQQSPERQWLVAEIILRSICSPPAPPTPSLGSAPPPPLTRPLFRAFIHQRAPGTGSLGHLIEAHSPWRLAPSGECLHSRAVAEFWTQPLQREMGEGCHEGGAAWDGKGCRVRCLCARRTCLSGREDVLVVVPDVSTSFPLVFVTPPPGLL